MGFVPKLAKAGLFGLTGLAATGAFNKNKNKDKPNPSLMTNTEGSRSIGGPSLINNYPTRSF